MKATGLQILLTALAAFLCGSAATTWLGARTTAAHIPQLPPSTAAEPQVNLDVHLPEFRVESETLAQVVDDLAQRTGQNFAVDWSNLASGSLPSDRILPVTLRLRDVTLREALDALVRILSEAAFQSEYVVRHGVIIFTGNGRTYETPVTRVYDIRDLIERQRAFMHERNLKTGDSPLVEGEPAINEVQAAADWVIHAVQNAVSPGDGSDRVGRWSELVGRLIVTALPEVHQQIEKVFDSLRRDPSPGPIRIKVD
jgi:hypothetical protein